MLQSGRFSYVLLSSFGIVISAWLLYHHVEVRAALSTAPSFCSINAFLDCDKVAKSDFSEFFGVPVASLGIAYFSLFLIFAARFPLNRSFHSAAFFLSLCALPLVLFELGVSLFLIQALCLMCGAIYLLVFILSGISFRRKSEGAVHGARELFFVANGALRKKPVEFLLLPLFGAGALLVAPEFIQHNIPRRPPSKVGDPLLRWKEAAPRSINVNTEGSLEERDFSRGSKGSPQVVIYSDFECPHCRDASTLFDELKKVFDFHLVYKNFPLDKQCNRLLEEPMHQFACQAAVMSRCAGAQGEEMFWQMHDTLFFLPELNDQAIREAAAHLGLDLSLIDQCINDPRTVARIKQDVEEGVELAIAATPAVYLNGKLLPSLDRKFLEQIFHEERVPRKE